MNEAVESKKVKERSPTFPFISLERALERAKQFYAEERRGIAPFTRAVMHWGYSDSSSGGLQTVSALKSYGLLNEMGGSGKQRQLQLSELALHILLDSRSDSTDRDRYIQVAAVSPTIAAEVHQKWPGRLPGDSTINHFLVLEKRFGEASAASAIQILKENQTFAKLDFVDMQSLPNENEVNEPPALPQLTQSRSPVSAVPAAMGNSVPMDTQPREVSVSMAAGEKEWLRGTLSKTVSYRLIVSGELGAREIGKLIKLLEAQKAVLDDDDDESL